MSEDIVIPKLPKCVICNHADRFAIQKMIDDGATSREIMKKFNINSHSIKNHINKEHRANLLNFGQIDYVMRKKNIDVALTLVEFIEKWKSGMESRVEPIKDSDAIHALELYAKAEGNLVNKHEITVKRSIEDALKDFLDCNEETKEE